MAILAVRSMGWLQPVEWTALDIYFQLRPTEAIDSRITVVGFEEKDIQVLKGDRLSDKLLAQLLALIKKQKPRVIGLDLFRDVPVIEGYPQLAEVFRTTPNLIGIEKLVGDKYYPKTAPPPILKQLNQVAAVDTVVDGDGVIRRAILFPDESSQNLGVATALIYLKKQGISADSNANRSLVIKDATFTPLKRNDGGYVRTDSDGYQILLNFRNPSQSFTRISITDVLSGRYSNLLRDRIVLVGATAPSFNDRFATPYSWNLSTTPIEIPGVEIQAQIASSIISSALDNRPVIKTLNEPLELLWISCWTVGIVILASRWRRTSDTKNFAPNFFFKLMASSLVVTVAVVGISYLAFLHGWWIPVVPPFLALALSPLVIANYTYISKLNERGRSLEVKVTERTQDLKLSNQQLEQSIVKVTERTQDLKLSNQQLEQSMQQLKDAQQQLLIASKLASMGSLMASVGHEIRNPLNFVSMLAENDIDLTKQLKLEIEQEYEYLPIEIAEDFREMLTDIIVNNEDIKREAKRIDLIVQIMQSSKEYIDTPPQLTEINDLLSLASRLVFYGLLYENKDFKVSLKTEYDNSIEPVNLRELDISRALINIINNACFAAYERSLVEPNLKPEVLVKTRNLIESNSIEIVIQDNGLGIPQNILDKIFDPFFTTKPQDKGTGVGLYFAHDLIVDKNGGQIKVDSKLGVYTTFTIILPKNVAEIV
jgi:CHASE2 domain-containing sensor protein/nitrogen-specific signal transduction histidine kinase